MSYQPKVQSSQSPPCSNGRDAPAYTASEKSWKPEGKPKNRQSFSIEKLITEAIVALAEARGSSSVAIARYISKNYDGLDANKKARISTTLKKMVARGKLVKVKASYKLPPLRIQSKSYAKRTVAASPRKGSTPMFSRFSSICDWLINRRHSYGSILIPAGVHRNICNVPALSLNSKNPQRQEKEDAKLLLKQKRAQEREDAKKQREVEREQKRIEDELKRRYPMEDTNLVALGEAGVDPPVGEPLYIKFGFPTELFPDLLMISEALKVLEEPLDLPELSLPLLRDELLKGSGCSGKLIDLEIKLAKLIVVQCAEPICGCRFEDLPLDAVSWAETFRQYLLTTDVVGSDVSLVCEWLQSQDHHLLTLKQRTSVLSLLVNLGFELEEVRDHLNQVNERVAEINREWHNVRNERRSKLKEGLSHAKKTQDAVNAEKKAKLMAAKAGEDTHKCEVASTNSAPTEAANKGESIGDKEDQLDWKAYGHEWIGLRIRRAFKGRRSGVENAGSGTITKWVPADESNPEEDPALWHVVHDDADEEDLEADEVREGLSLLKMYEDSQDSEFEAKISEAQQELRFEPLGLDRYHCRYWLVDSETEFLRGCLVVQRPAGAPEVDDGSCCADNGESTVSEDEILTHETLNAAGVATCSRTSVESCGASQNGECWRSFRKPEHLAELMDALNEKGEREFRLQMNLEKRKAEMDTLLNPSKKSNILQAVKHREGEEYGADEEGTADPRVFKMVCDALQDAEKELEQFQIKTPHEEYHEAYKAFKHVVENANKPRDLQHALHHLCHHIKPSVMEEMWASSKDEWNSMCDQVTTAGQAGLVLSIFHTMMKGKKAAAVILKKGTKQKQQDSDGNWCNKGHKWIGKTVRRNYGMHGHNVGEISKWMPADENNPNEDPALWHVVFDDGDEEDLDEAEVEEALKEFESKGNVDSPSKPNAKKWKSKGHEWIGASVRVDFGQAGFSICKVIKWTPAAKSRKKGGPMWLVVDDEDEEHTMDRDQMEDALESFANHEEFGSSNDDKGDDIEWQFKGHEWLNRCVLRDYGREGTNQGTIQKWVPANPDNPEEDVALWHVVFDDGDEEDLEETEVEEALKLYASKGRRKRGGSGGQQDSSQHKRSKCSKESSDERDEWNGSDGETQSDNDVPTVTMSGRIRVAPQRFKAGPASVHAR